MAAFRRTKSGRRADVDVEEKREYRLAPKNAVENFVFVACTNVKEEPEGAVDKDVATLKESSVPECEVRTKKDTDKVGAFEEISVPECDVHVKEEADETDAIAAAAVPERDPLQIEEEELVATTRSSPDSERLTQKTRMGRSTLPAAAIRRTAAHCHSVTGPVTSRGSASRGRRPKGRSRKPTFGARDSVLGGVECDNFTCNSCQETFQSKYELLTHVFIHIDKVEPPPNICRLCGDVFQTQRSLQIHCLNIHLKSHCIAAKKECRLLDTDKKQSNCHKVRSIRSPRNTAECRRKNISQRSPNDGTLNQRGKNSSHLESSDGDNCRRFISKGVTLPKHKHSQIEEIRNESHEDNTSSADLKRHVVFRTVGPPYKCNDCDRYFKHQVHLQQHAVTHRKKPIVCNSCGRTFKRPVDLRQHTLSHTGEKPHVCKCGKSFAKSGSLKRHEMVHRGERPFRCDMCLKTFTDAGVLKKHALVHTGERAHVCRECGKAFKELGHLRRHSLLHTGEKPHVCRTCGMSFTQSASLIRHTRIHTGEKPYKCDVCFKSFADHSNWRVHLLTNHEEETYKCDMCEKRFLKHSALLHHIRMHIV